MGDFLHNPFNFLGKTFNLWGNPPFSFKLLGETPLNLSFKTGFFLTPYLFFPTGCSSLPYPFLLFPGTPGLWHLGQVLGSTGSFFSHSFPFTFSFTTFQATPFIWAPFIGTCSPPVLAPGAILLPFLSYSGPHSFFVGFFFQAQPHTPISTGFGPIHFQFPFIWGAPFWGPPRPQFRGSGSRHFSGGRVSNNSLFFPILFFRVFPLPSFSIWGSPRVFFLGFSHRGFGSSKVPQLSPHLSRVSPPPLLHFFLPRVPWVSLFSFFPCCTCGALFSTFPQGFSLPDFFCGPNPCCWVSR